MPRRLLAIEACGFMQVEVDPLDEVHAARSSAGDARSLADDERRLYLVRAERPAGDA